MSSFELNKIFAALLVAGIVAMLSSFVSAKLIHPEIPEKDAVFIEGTAVVAGGAAAKADLPDPILHLVASADIAKGEKLSKACAACHSFEKGGPNKVGPNLWGVVGSQKAGRSGFSYSDVLAGKGGDWDYASLNEFLWKPKKYVPGTKMNYIGLKKPEDRAAIVAWLRTLSDAPIVLPSEADIAEEALKFAPEEESVAEGVSDEAESVPEDSTDLNAHDGEPAPAGH